jgi:hypothetical protein
VQKQTPRPASYQVNTEVFGNWQCPLHANAIFSTDHPSDQNACKLHRLGLQALAPSYKCETLHSSLLHMLDILQEILNIWRLSRIHWFAMIFEVQHLSHKSSKIIIASISNRLQHELLCLYPTVIFQQSSYIAPSSKQCSNPTKP